MQKGQSSDDIDRDEDERAGESNFDDCFCFMIFEYSTNDQMLRFARAFILLPFENMARKDYILEIEYRESIVFELIGGMMCYDVIPDSNQLTEL